MGFIISRILFILRFPAARRSRTSATVLSLLGISQILACIRFRLSIFAVTT